MSDHPITLSKPLSNITGMDAKSNIVSPFLWLFFPLLISTVTISVFGKSEQNQLIIIWLLILISIIILSVVTIYVYLMKTKQMGLLRSEHHHLEEKRLDLEGRKGDEHKHSKNRLNNSDPEEINNG